MLDVFQLDRSRLVTASQPIEHRAHIRDMRHVPAFYASRAGGGKLLTLAKEPTRVLQVGGIPGIQTRYRGELMTFIKEVVGTRYVRNVRYVNPTAQGEWR